MKKLVVVIGLCCAAFFLAKVLEYVFEYYELHTSWVTVKRS